MLGWQITRKIIIQARFDKPDREDRLTREFSFLDKVFESPQRKRDLLSLPGVR
jgi:hypothetical protein